jgi:hypothetical protein
MCRGPERGTVYQPSLASGELRLRKPGLVKGEWHGSGSVFALERFGEAATA